MTTQWINEWLRDDGLTRLRLRAMREFGLTFHDAEDAVQSTLVRALPARFRPQRARGRDPVGIFLKHILKRVIQDFWKKRQRDRSLEFESVIRKHADSQHGPSPQQTTISRERTHRIVESVRRHAGAAAFPFLAHAAGGVPLTRLSELHHRSPTALKADFRAARRRLRAALPDESVERSDRKAA